MSSTDQKKVALLLDQGFRFMSEKTSHNPPILVANAIGKGWTWHQENKPKTKFWGKSIELTTGGATHVYLERFNETYSWEKIKTCMRNVIGGTRYLEHYGDLQITNHTTSHYVIMNFKESGLFTTAKDEISGHVFSPDGTKLAILRGRWSECLYHQVSSDKLEIIWKGNAPHPEMEGMYGFTPFAVQLNEITNEMRPYLPCTDTRLRPDIRHLEVI